MERSDVSVTNLSISGADLTMLPNGGPPSSEELHDIAKFKQTPLLFTVNYHLDLDSPVKPYVGVGLGYYFNDVSDTERAHNLGIYNQNVDDSIGYHITAGIEYPVTDDYLLFLAGRYVKNEADVSATTPAGYKEDTAKLDRYDFSLGFKYRF